MSLPLNNNTSQWISLIKYSIILITPYHAEGNFDVCIWKTFILEVAFRVSFTYNKLK